MQSSSCGITDSRTQQPDAWSRRPGAVARAFPSEQMVRLICRALPDPQARAGLAAVDIGCGNGRNSTALATLGFRPVISVDPSDALLARAVAAARRHGHDLDARRGGLPNLPLDSRSANLAVAWGVLYVLGDHNAVLASLREVARVLRPGGLLVSDWRTDADHLRRFADQRLDERTFRLSPAAPLSLGGALYSFWSDEAVRSVHHQAGFELLDMQREELHEVLAGPRYSWWQCCARRAQP